MHQERVLLFKYSYIYKKIAYLLTAVPIEHSARQNMRERPETMEQHGSKLNDQDQSEEKDKHQTNRLQLQILL